MSSLRRRLLAVVPVAVLAMALSAGQARAQCRGMQRGSGGSQQTSSLSTTRQANALRTSLMQGSGLQSTTGLQTALQQVTAQLAAAQQAGATAARINQLVTLQLQLNALLLAAQQQTGSLQGR
jgi:hypothetical protein